VGLDVVRDGVLVGVIDRLEHLPAQDLLVVKVDDREVLIPFVKAIVPEVDVDGGRVVVTPPDGLFETLPDEPEALAAETDGAETAEQD
jgi:16S rRNA processing protein RimM